MLTVHNNQPVYALEHLVKVLFHFLDVLNDTTHLDDLLVAEEVESWEALSLILNVLGQATH